jgi:hypothetical protein
MTISVCIGYVRIAEAGTWREAMTLLRADIGNWYPQMLLTSQDRAALMAEELAALEHEPDAWGLLVTSGSWAWADSQRFARAGEHGLDTGDLAIVHDFSNGSQYERTIDVLCKITAIFPATHMVTVRITQHDSAQFGRGELVTLPLTFLRPRPRKPAPLPAGEWQPRTPDGVRVTADPVTEIVSEYELTAEERKEFDYLDWAAIDAGTDSATFFRRRGDLYSLDQFMAASPEMTARGWHGYAGDSFFSGVVVRLIDDDTIQTGLLLA